MLTSRIFGMPKTNVTISLRKKKHFPNSKTIFFFLRTQTVTNNPAEAEALATYSSLKGPHAQTVFLVRLLSHSPQDKELNTHAHKHTKWTCLFKQKSGTLYSCQLEEILLRWASWSAAIRENSVKSTLSPVVANH